MEIVELVRAFLWGWTVFIGNHLYDNAVEYLFVVLYVALTVLALLFFRACWRRRGNLKKWWNTPKVKTQGIVIMGRAKRKDFVRLTLAQAYADALMQLQCDGTLTNAETNEAFRAAARSMGWWELCPRYIRLSNPREPDFLKAEIKERVVGKIGEKIVVKRIPIPDMAEVHDRRTQKKLAAAKKPRRLTVATA